MKDSTKVTIVIVVMLALMLVGFITTIIGTVYLIKTIGSIEKTPITANQFENFMKSNNWTVLDNTSQFLQEGKNISKGYITNKGKCEIEFYIFLDNDDTIDFYNINKAKFETQAGNVFSKSNVNLKNYSKYSLTSNGKYKCVSRIDNTAIYINVDSDYKEGINNILYKLGY